MGGFPAAIAALPIPTDPNTAMVAKIPIRARRDIVITSCVEGNVAADRRAIDS